jgi:hypothetical protein
MVIFAPIMRNIITAIVTVSMLLLGITASAQASLGAGYAVSTDHGTNDCKLPGFYVGTSYNFTYSGRVGIAPGVYYHQFKGKDLPSFGFDESISEAVEKYISIPVLFNIGLKFSPNLFFRVYQVRFSLMDCCPGQESLCMTTCMGKRTAMTNLTSR